MKSSFFILLLAMSNLTFSQSLSSGKSVAYITANTNRYANIKSAEKTEEENLISTADYSSSKKMKAFGETSIINMKVQLGSDNDINKAQVSFNNKYYANTYIRLLNVRGQVLKVISLGNVKEGNNFICLRGLAKGAYYVQLACDMDIVMQTIWIE
jgi:hypothetical protein